MAQAMGLSVDVEDPFWRAADPFYASLVEWFRPVNLIPDRPGYWSLPEARVTADVLRGGDPARCFVLLGRRVASAFRLGGAAYFDRLEVEGRMMVVVPHPSGLNRLLNDPAVRDQMGEVLRWAAWLPVGDVPCRISV